MLTDMLTKSDWVTLANEIIGVMWPVFAFCLFLALLILKETRALHHGYYGLALVFPPFDLPLALRLLGLVLLVDDAVQHAVQIVMPSFRSPVNVAYRRVFGRLHERIARTWAYRRGQRR